MRLLIFFLVWIFSLEETGQNPFESSVDSDRQRILQRIFPESTDLEKWLVSRLPDDFVKNFPNLDPGNLSSIHPDVFWRLPGEQGYGFSGTDLADLVVQSGLDASVIRKASLLLKSGYDSDRIDFLNNLPALTSYAWKIIGELKHFVLLFEVNEPELYMSILVLVQDELEEPCPPSLSFLSQTGKRSSSISWDMAQIKI